MRSDLRTPRPRPPSRKRARATIRRDADEDEEHEAMIGPGNDAKASAQMVAKREDE